MIKTDDLKDVLFRASQIIENYFNSETEVNIKSDNSPVTIADLETNTFLKKELLRLLPSAGWLSEEDKDNNDRFSKEYVWIVDPLDGTKEFVARVPQIAITVALVKDNHPVMGGIINPVSKEGGICSAWDKTTFWGFNEVSETNELDKAKIIVSRTEYNGGKLKDFEKELTNITPVGSVANKLLRIAAGVDDFYFSVVPKSEWDICGGVALINAAGKKYVRFDGKENLFNQKDVRILCGSAAGNETLINQFFDRYKNNIK